MNRSVLFTALLVGIVGAFAAPRFGPTTAFSPVFTFLVCSLGALAGLRVVWYALKLD